MDNVTLFENFRANLKAHCKASGVSYVELARRSGIHEVTISRIMNGRNCPSVDVCEKLARAAGARPDTIFLQPEENLVH